MLRRRHVVHTFGYLLRQDRHHGFEDPCHDGSCLPDLLGLRLVPGDVVRNVRAHLPRVTRKELLEHLGALRPALEPADALPRDAWAHLAAAAAASLGLSRLSSDRDSVRAKAAALKLARSVASPPSASLIASALGISKRTVRRLRQLEVEPTLVRAVEGQVRLRRRAALLTLAAAV